MRAGGLALPWRRLARTLATISTGWAQAQPVKGEATFSAADGYARLVLKLSEDVDSDVSVAGSIVVIRFKRPVDTQRRQTIRRGARLCRIGAARSRRLGDPAVAGATGHRQRHDGRRAHFRRSVAGQLERSAAGLPQEVIRELSERARAAERALRQQRAAEAALKRAPVRVRASVQPTFVRFVFEMPDGVGVSSALNDQKLTLLFNTALTFDLADAKAGGARERRLDQPEDRGRKCAVEFALIGDVDVHSFREEKNYIVDVAFQSENPSPLAAPAAPTPARPADKPADEAPPQRPARSRRRPGDNLRKKPGLKPKPEPATKPPSRRSAAGRSRAGSRHSKETPAASRRRAAAENLLAAAEPPAETKPAAVAGSMPGATATGCA